MKNKLILSVLALPLFILATPSARAVSATSLTGVDVGGSSAGANVSANATVGIQSTTTTVHTVTTVNGYMPSLSPVSVQTDTDLKTYNDAVVKSDASVNAVATSENNVSMTFNRPAKLFGFIPVTAKESVTVTADAQGTETVSVSKSWWSFLAKTNFLSDSLSSNLQSKLSSEGSLSTSATLSASAKAKILSDIQASSNAVYANASNSTQVSY